MKRAHAAFQMASAPESDSVERLVEVFQGDAWSGGGASVQDMIEMYRVTCSARECPILPASEGDMESVRERIAELGAGWELVPVSKALELELNASFATTQPTR